MKDILAKILAGVSRDSVAKSFNLNDAWHTIHLAFIGGLLAFTQVFYQAIDKHDFGAIDGILMIGVTAGYGAIVSFLSGRKKAVEQEEVKEQV